MFQAEVPVCMKARRSEEVKLWELLSVWHPEGTEQKRYVEMWVRKVGCLEVLLLLLLLLSRFSHV